MPHNVAYGANGFNAPPMINTGGPTSPGMSSGGIPSPGSVHSPAPSGMQVLTANMRPFTPTAPPSQGLNYFEE